MSKSRKIALFLLFCLVLSLAAATAPKLEANTTGDAENEGEDTWDAFETGDFGIGKLKDWSYYNYSSNEWHARDSLVRGGDKIYDPLSFKGGVNDTYAVAFHLSIEVAVSAAQARNGTLFNVAVVKGNEDYKNMMAQIQQDLKGDRSIYYTETDCNPGWSWNDWIGHSRYSNYFHRIYNYLHHGPPPPFTPDPTPVFTSILSSLKLATEEELGVKMNHTQNRYDRGLYLSAPWDFNETLTRSLRNAMNSLSDTDEGFWFVGPDTRPWADWDDHANDMLDYGGENGTKMAFEQAKKGAEMMEFDWGYRYGDFYCGTYLVEEEMRVRSEMIANGTWVEPARKMTVPWECRNWEECWRAWPWRWRMGE